MAPPLPPYPQITRAMLRQSLLDRLNSAQFWGNPAELNGYINEALTVWQAMARYWKQAVTFDTHLDGAGNSQFFYDLRTEVPQLSQNSTDAQLLSQIEYHLIEPQSGIPSAPTWAGTSMFPQDAYTDALTRRRDRFLLDTASVIGHYSATGVVAGSPRVVLPPSIIDVRRLAFQSTLAPSVGAVSTAGTPVVWVSGAFFATDGSWNGKPITINGVGYTINNVLGPTLLALTTSAGTQAAVPYLYGGPPVLVYAALWRDDEFAANAFDQGWMTTPGLPTPAVWSMAVTQPYTVQLIPPPGDAGALDLLAIAQGPQLNPAAGVALGTPDNYAWAIKYGAMADILSQDGPGLDLQRAAYCEARYQEGVQLCRTMPSVLNASINGNSALLDSVFNFDTYSTDWHNTVGTPQFLGLAGQTLLATSCVPDPANPVGIGLDVVVNAPVPTNDSAPLGITADQAERIVDEAQHIAIFKSGGAEFAASLALHKGFVQYAKMYRDRSLAQAPFWPAMSGSDQLEFQQNMVTMQ